MNYFKRILFFILLSCSLNSHLLNAAATSDDALQELADKVCAIADSYCTVRGSCEVLFELEAFCAENLDQLRHHFSNLSDYYSNVELDLESVECVFKWIGSEQRLEAKIKESYETKKWVELFQKLRTTVGLTRIRFLQIADNKLNSPEQFCNYANQAAPLFNFVTQLIQVRSKIIENPVDEPTKVDKSWAEVTDSCVAGALVTAARENHRMGTICSDALSRFRKDIVGKTKYEKERDEKVEKYEKYCNRANFPLRIITAAYNYIFAQCKKLIQLCQTPEVAELIENGIEHLNTPDANGQTPVMRAYLAGRREVVTFLMKLGCSLTAADNQGQTMLHFAAANKDADMVVLLCDIEDAQMNARTALGESALMVACREYDKTSEARKTISKLVHSRANIGIRDHEGRAAMYWARKRQRRNSVEKILSRDLSEIKLNDVCGINQEVLDLFYAASYGLKDYKLGQDFSEFILLHGPQGTGKTSLARALANEAECAFHQIACSNLVERWAGATTENLRNFFENARKEKPCVIFLDEIDSIAIRSSGSHGASISHNKTVDQLKTLLDGFDPAANHGVVVIAATNNPDELDPAIRGRFREPTLIDIPNFEGRLEILEHYVAKIPHITIFPDYLVYVAEQTEGYSGRDLYGLIKSVKRQPQGRIAEIRREIAQLERNGVRPNTVRRLKEELNTLTNGGDGATLTQEHFDRALQNSLRARRRRRR